MDAEVSTHTFLTMIIEASVCFMSCEPFVVGAIILMWYTRNTFLLSSDICSSTEQCAWAIISPKEFKYLRYLKENVWLIVYNFKNNLTWKSTQLLYILNYRKRLSKMTENLYYQCNLKQKQWLKYKTIEFLLNLVDFK